AAALSLVAAKGREGVVIDLATRLEAALLLEGDQGLLGARPKNAVGFADVESLTLQFDLYFANLSAIEIYGAGRAGALFHSSARRSRRDHCDDMAIGVDDNNIVAHHEILVSAPFGMNLDQNVRHRNDAHFGRKHCAYIERKRHVVNARYVATR